MKFELIYTAADYLANTLFWVSKSKKAKKIKSQTVVLLVAFCLVISISSYFNDNYPMTGFFIVLAIAVFFFYPIYQRWYYKKYYLKFIKHGFKDKIGQPCEIEFKDTAVSTKDSSGEAEMELDQIEEIRETGAYYFIKFNTEESLIVPKDGRTPGGFEEVLARITQKYEIPLVRETDWKWK